MPEIPRPSVTSAGVAPPPSSVPTALQGALVCSNIMAVASGKGGVGKTWFSITLCHALAQQGKKVLLFDADFGLANVDVQLGLTPGRDLGHVLAGACTLKEALFTYVTGGFTILPGRSGSGGLASLSAKVLEQLRAEVFALAPQYDLVVMDLGAGLDQAVRSLALAAGLVSVIVTEEPTSLTDAYAFIKLTHAANPTADVRVVVNQAAAAELGRRTYETLQNVCTTFLNKNPPLLGIVRDDSHVRESIRLQTPLLERFPSSRAASDVESVARTLSQMFPQDKLPIKPS